jgi:predicted P-loop ATPase
MDRDVWENPPKKKPKAEAPKTTRLGLADAVLRLRQPEWDCLAWNERTAELVWLKEPPCETAHTSFPSPFVDADFTSIVSALACEDLVLSYETAVKAAMRAGTFRAFDPVREYINDLAWDGTARIGRWLETHFGAVPDDDDDETTQAQERQWNEEVGKRFLISAVARVYDPGCQVDTILIAEGAQGIGKSSAFRALLPNDDWFATDLPDIKGKDAVHHVLGPWIIELDELDALNRRETTSVKSYISRRTDRARLSYGRLATNHPRRVVFAGTTNEDAYNQDATGGRRYWPFRVRNTIDVQAIEQDRDQLWAEAVALYRAGHPWHLDGDELQTIAKSEQAKRFKGGPWLERIRDFVIGKTEVTVTSILDDCLEIEKARQSQRDMNEVVRCLQYLGWRIRQVRRDGRRVRVYESPERWDVTGLARVAQV